MINTLNLVIADIDGTLVRDDHILSDETKHVLNTLHDHGILLGLASGRSVLQLKQRSISEWNLSFSFDVIIGLNGGEIFDTKSNHLESIDPLSPSSIKDVVTMMSPLNLNPFLYRDNKMLAQHLDKGTQSSSERNHQAVEIASDISEMWNTSAAKVMFRVTEAQMPEVEQWAKTHPSPFYQSIKTQTTMLEFMSPNVNKGNALSKYSKYASIPLETMMSFGDMSNDNELLRTAGWGVCMKNGSSDAKASANDITEYTNNENGFAQYIASNVLPVFCK